MALLQERTGQGPYRHLQPLPLRGRAHRAGKEPGARGDLAPPLRDHQRFREEPHPGGITVLKFFLHISKDEQKRRLQRRLDNPDKRWKFDHSDIGERLLWDEYQGAYQGMINACSTDHAPWYVVPADKKWYRNLVVARTIADTLEAMDPRYPPAEEGLENVTIPD